MARKTPTGTRPFWVVAGCDYSGKSSLLRALREAPPGDVTPVSYDDGFIPEGFELIATLRDAFVNPRGASRRFSDDFVLSVLHTTIVYLSDMVAAAPASHHVIVDSYYYKLLVKCRLFGIVDEAVFDRWRALPQPTGVVFLDVDPARSWERSGRGADVNDYERGSGDGDAHARFVSLQSRLRTELLAEIGSRPLHMLSPSLTVDAVAAQVRRLFEGAPQ